MRGQGADNSADVLSSVNDDPLCRKYSSVETAEAVCLYKALLGDVCGNETHPVKVSVNEHMGLFGGAAAEVGEYVAVFISALQV